MTPKNSLLAPQPTVNVLAPRRTLPVALPANRLILVLNPFKSRLLALRVMVLLLLVGKGVGLPATSVPALAVTPPRNGLSVVIITSLPLPALVKLRTGETPVSSVRFCRVVSAALFTVTVLATLLTVQPPF